MYSYGSVYTTFLLPPPLESHYLCIILDMLKLQNIEIMGIFFFLIYTNS